MIAMSPAVSLRRVLLAVAAVSSAAALAAASGVVADDPFVVRELAWKASLWTRGARPVRRAGLDGWVSDGCRAGEACRCVTLVHGLGDTALTWRRLLSVRPGARLVAFDLPGVDGSRRPAGVEGFSIRAQARAVWTALDGMCPAPRAAWTVAGNSLGGWIAGWMALERPDAVERLVLLNAAGLKDDSGLAEGTARILAFPTGAQLEEFAGRALHAKHRLPDWVWDKLAERVRRTENFRILTAIRDEDFLDRAAARITAPTTILWGVSDHILPAAFAARYARAIPGAVVRTLAGCGHMPQSECPEAVLPELFAKPRG